MKILALYLPQFHRIKENDEWWGEGFTEWVNVKKAKPLFPEHNQPRVPSNNNYYDLTNVETIKWQTEIAKKYGIYGFCVYHYWFQGHLLLEKPMELFLKNKDINFPICFCWANEHWTNAWVSGENRILIEQKFDDKNDWINHFNYMLSFFKDERYIKEDNKPLFVIYIPNIMKNNVKEFIECWNKLAILNGFDGIKFIFQHQLYYNEKTSDKCLFDYGIQFQPSLSMMHIKDKKSFFSEKFRTKVSIFLQTKLGIYLKKKKIDSVKQFDYDELWNDVLSMRPSKEDFVTIPGAFVDWDNTSRRGINGSCINNTTVEKFEKYFDLQVKNCKKYYNTSWLVIFSWNEWAEGGYLEPDEHNGYKYLEAIKKVLEKNGEI